ncbi:MAG TPA: hypothetical protein VGG39_13120 [Polyangiaceae bacterium]|jgi:hypothetical protein
MTRVEIATPLCLGTILGLAAGILLGMAAGVFGMMAGIAIGAAAGVLAGAAMHHDEEHRSARGRELDALIGVAGGDLGAAPISAEAVDGESAKAWMAEWLTPPPPVAS